jgi:O-antigen/teichoic acid export membrane protein
MTTHASLGPGHEEQARLTDTQARRDSIKRNAILSLTNRLTSAVFTAILTLYLVRALGPDGYGTFALAVSVGVLASLLADFGVSASASRFVAEHAGDSKAQFAVIALALKLKLAFVGAIAVALFALAAPISDAYGVQGLEWPLRGAAIALAGQTLLLFVTGLLGALRRVSANAPVILSESALEMTASVALVALGTGATGATFGRAIGYTLGGILAIVVLSRVIGRSALGRPADGQRQGRRIASYALPVFITNGVFTLFSQIDVILLGALIGSAAVGVFQAPVRFISMLTYAGTALAAGVGPTLAVKGNRNISAFEASIRYLIIGQALLIAPVIVWADPIVDLLLGPDYQESVPVLRAMAPFVFLSGIGPFLSSAVNYLGGAGRRVPIAIAAVAANATIDLILIPPLGVLAGAIGTDIGYLIYVPAHFWVCRRTLGLPLRPIAITLGRCALAATAMGLVLLAAGTDDLSIAGWALGGTSALVAYFGSLLITRELEPDEFRALARWIGRRARRRRRAGTP